MVRLSKRAARKQRKKRENKYVLVKWLGEYYVLSPTEAELAMVWISVRGESMANLPYGRQVKCLDLNSKEWIRDNTLDNVDKLHRMSAKIQPSE